MSYLGYTLVETARRWVLDGYTDVRVLYIDIHILLRRRIN